MGVAMVKLVQHGGDAVVARPHFDPHRRLSHCRQHFLRLQAHGQQALGHSIAEQITPGPMKNFSRSKPAAASRMASKSERSASFWRRVGTLPRSSTT